MQGYCHVLTIPCFFNPETPLGQEQDFRLSLCQDLCYIERVYEFI